MGDGSLKFQPVFNDKTYTDHFYKTDNWKVLKFDVIENYAFSVVRDCFNDQIGVVCHSLQEKDWYWLDLNGQKLWSLTVGKVGKLPAAKAVVDGEPQTCHVMPKSWNLNLPYTEMSESKFVSKGELPISVRKLATPFKPKGEKLSAQHATKFNNKHYLVQLWKVESGYKIRLPILKPITKEKK